MDDEKSFIGILFCSLISPKEEKAEKLKLKKAIEKGNMEVKLSMVLILMMQYFPFKVAKIHAENAIRQKNQSLNYLRMSAR